MSQFPQSCQIKARPTSPPGPPRLPVEVVLAPEWWHAHAGISFDRDFFFHPLRRGVAGRQAGGVGAGRRGAVGREVDESAAFSSAAFRRLEALVNQLKTRHGFVAGDVNWGGILNVAL